MVDPQKPSESTSSAAAQPQRPQPAAATQPAAAQPQRPQPAAATQPAAAAQPKTGGKVTEILVNGKSVTKLRLEEGTNVDEVWATFQKDHASVSDKQGAFPTSFVGELVNKHGAVQVDEPATEQKRLRLQ